MTALRGGRAALPVALAAGVAAGTAVLYRIGSGTTFRGDEWAFILFRRSHTVDAYFEPYNDHLSALLVGFYQALFAIAGLHTYVPYRIGALALHGLLVVLVFIYVRRCGGDVPALAAAIALLFFGPGVRDILWPFQIGFLAPLAGGLAALLLVERRSRGADIASCAVLGAAIAFGSYGVLFAFLVALEFLLARDVRRLWVPGIPLAAYAIWYTVYQPSGGSTSLRGVPRFAFDAAAGALGELVGLSVTFGRPLLVLLGAAAVFVLLRSPRHPRSMAVLGTAVLFWVLLAFKRAEFGEPTASRYLYPGAVFLLLLGAEIARARRPGPVAAASVAIVAVVAFVPNIRAMRAGGDDLRQDARAVRSQLGALEIARAHARGEVRLPYFSYFAQGHTGLPAELYFAATDALGSVAAEPSELHALPESDRNAVDGVLIELLPISVRSGGGACPVPGEVRVAPTEAAIIRAPLEVRRFASVFSRIPAPPAAVVSFPRDEAPGEPWIIARACAA